MTLIDLLGEPVCGMTWGWTGVRGTWATPAAAASMTEMASAGVTWTATAYAAEQQTAFSTAIPFDAEPTVTDDEIVWAIRAATERGVFCVGCEMVRADGQEQQWRTLIARVREVYSGLVTYNCDKYQEDRVTWWDAVDIISSSGYYPIDQWERQLDRIGGVVAAADRPFFFMEAGCPSRTGSAALPNNWALPGAPSGEEQLRYYTAMFAACRARPWVGGLMLWDWSARLYALADAESNDDYCPYGKPAGQYLESAYRQWQADARAE